jgi:predicted porin
VAVLGNASVYSLAASASNSQTVVAVGLRHKF